MAILAEPEDRSAGALGPTGILSEPQPLETPPPPRALGPDPAAKPIVVSPWRYDQELSWYGPNFYGQHTACGQILTTTLLGVAHKTLPCGTRVTLRRGHRIVRVRVVDRGPYAGGREFDLTAATRARLRFEGVGSVLVTR